MDTNTQPDADTAPTPERFNDCPRTTAAMQHGYECKPNHYYTTADFSDSLEREIAKLTAERDSALARVAEALSTIGWRERSIEKLEEERARLSDENAALRKDKERVRQGLCMPWWQTKITVCDKCFQATCWQGVFMCDESQNAGTAEKTIAELIALKTGEHPDHWTTSASAIDAALASQFETQAIPSDSAAKCPKCGRSGWVQGARAQYKCECRGGVIPSPAHEGSES